MRRRLRGVRGSARDQRGMTVAEVIIALFVITVGLVGLMAAIPLSTSQIGEAHLKTTATFLAQQRVEQIRNAQWTGSPAADTLGGSGSNGSSAVAEWPDESAVTNYSRFARTVRIVDCSVSPGCGMTTDSTLATLRQVTVTVRFARMTGIGTINSSTLESVQLITFIARQ